jgi:hypothetical protein
MPLWQFLTIKPYSWNHKCGIQMHLKLTYSKVESLPARVWDRPQWFLSPDFSDSLEPGILKYASCTLARRQDINFIWRTLSRYCVFSVNQFFRTWTYVTESQNFKMVASQTKNTCNSACGLNISEYTNANTSFLGLSVPMAFDVPELQWKSHRASLGCSLVNT